MNKAEIHFKDVEIGYPGQASIIERLNYQVSTEVGGKVVALMGKSGSGKTSLLKLIARQLVPRSGGITVQPDDLIVSALPQERVIFEHLSVERNARYFSEIKSVKQRFSERRFQRLSDLLGFGPSLFQRGVGLLSGGEQQRLALLRALSIGPHILLLDEPCSGLDPVVKQRFLVQLRHVIDSEGILAFYVTHHIEEASLIADELIFLDTAAGFPAKAVFGPLQKLVEKPPSLDLARMTGGGPVNEIQCRVELGLVFLEGGGAIAKVMDASEPEFLRDRSASFYLLFPPNALFLADAGVMVRSTSRSDVFYFVEVASGERLVGLVERQQAQGPPKQVLQRVGVRGVGQCFSTGGAERGRLWLDLIG